MKERAENMFLNQPNGPHASGLLAVQARPTNSLLELARKAAHGLWVAEESRIKAACPELWDEELMRGWLLSDALGCAPKDEATARTVGKRAATQIGAANQKASKVCKAARKHAATETREGASKEATEAVWAAEYASLFNGLDGSLTCLFGCADRRFPAIAYRSHLPAVATSASPATCPAPQAQPSSTTVPLEDCCHLNFEESATSLASEDVPPPVTRRVSLVSKCVLASPLLISPE